MFWLGYLREITATAVRAGIYDGLACPDGSSGLTAEQAASALHGLLGDSAEEGQLGNNPSHTAGTPLPAPKPNGPAALPAPQKRGPGRPRKFQEPPEPPA